MSATEFLDRIASRIDRIDRKNLEHYLLDLAQKTKFIQLLFDRISEGVMVLNFEKEILFTNRRMVQLFNLPENTAQKKILEQAIPDEPLLALLSKAIHERREIFQEEFEVLLPRPMILNITLLIEKNEAPPFILLTISNLTGTEMDIRERFKLENWESMLGLAAGIAHEIGNPLNSITIHTKLLEQAFKKLTADDRKKAIRSLEVITDETARLDQIIRNFLRAARRKPLRFEVEQIHDLLTKTVSIEKPELKKLKIRIQSEFDKKIPPFLFDPERMQQAVLNIIKNATHAMPKGGLLKIHTEKKEKLCLIHFHDSGVGIPGHILPKIFDAYYTTREEGSGLGLMIVYQIIREHGGRIEVASRPKGGTTFTIILPIRLEKLRLPEPEKEKKP